MKKSIVIISLLCMSVALMAQETQQKVKGAHPYKLSENEVVSDKYAHWSLIPHIGFNAFDGDFEHEKKHAVSIPTAGLSLEYNFTPVWSLGIEYLFSQYNVRGDKSYQQTVDTLLAGHMHKIGAYLSMDLVNLFFPKAHKRIVSIMPMVGAGYAFYNSNKLYYDDDAHGRGNTLNYINKNGEVGPDKMDGYKGTLYLLAGGNIEFNLNRTLALGVRATYNYFLVDYVDGRGYQGQHSQASKNNDGLVDVTLNLRIKLAAVSKSHVRNVSNDLWMGGYTSVASTPTPAQAPVEPAQTIQYVHDTVIIQRDSVIIREQPVYVSAADGQLTNTGNISYVYFEQYKSTLRNSGLITIQQVADRMKESPDLYAVVVGYCDNTGTDDQNYELSDIRAGVVIDELQNEHNIGADHLYACGAGRVVGGRSQAAYGPNRRAVIRLVDKETFDSLKKELEQAKANRNK